MKLTFHLQKAIITALLLLGSIFSIKAQTAFQPGTIVVNRTVNKTNACRVHIDELKVWDIATATAVSGSSVVVDTTNTSSRLMPTAQVNNGVASSTNRGLVDLQKTNHGDINLSPDTKYLTLVGYNAAQGNSTLGSTTAIDKVVGIIKNDGSVDTRAAVDKGYFASDYRSAITDGTNIWCGGNSGGNTIGITVIPFPAASGSISPLAGTTILSSANSAAIINARALKIFNNQLYFAAAQGDVFGVSPVGSGLPITTPANPAEGLFPGITTTSAGSNYYKQDGFAMFDVDPSVPGLDVMYWANESAGGSPATGGDFVGLIKFYKDAAGTWHYAGKITALNGGATSVANVGCISVCGKKNHAGVLELYVTVGVTAIPQNYIYRVIDLNSTVSNYTSNITNDGTDFYSVTTTNANNTITRLITAPANSNFRGVNFAPTKGNLTVASNTSASGTYKDITVTGGTLTLTGDIYADNITVSTGATIDLSTYHIYSNGIGYSTFTLSSGATLKTGEANGLVTSGTTGAIQTDVRTFDAGANYYFTGSAPQATGNALPSTVNTLVIDNATGVTLTANVSATTLTLTSGVLSTGANTITVTGNTAPGGSATSYVNGNLQLPIPTGTNVSVKFDLGYGASSHYSPYTFNYPIVTKAGAIKASVVQYNSYTSGCIVTAKNVNLTWAFNFVSVPRPYFYNATVAYQSSDVDAGITSADVVAGIYNFPTSGVWDYAVSTQNFTTTGCTVYGVNDTTTATIPTIYFQLGQGTTPLPTTGNVTYCQYVTASPIAATGSNLLYYSSLQAGTGLPTAPTPSTAIVGAPAVSYWISQTISGCESNRAQVDVTVNAAPVQPTVSATTVNYCQNATTSQLSATGTSLMWYTQATGGIGSATAPTPSAASPGTTNYYVTQNNGTCESQRKQIAVTVIAAPTAPTVTSPTNLCQGATPSALTAGGVNLTWYNTSTTGTGGSSTSPTPSTSATGTPTVSYWVTQTIGGCPESPAAQIDVNVYAVPSAPSVTPAIAYCLNDASSALSASGSNLLWYSTLTGTGSATAPTPSTATATTINNYVSQTQNGCESPKATIVVTVNPLPAMPTATSTINYCQNVTASVLSASGTNLQWYASATGGVGSSTAPTPSTVSIGAPVSSYFATQTDANGCESPRKQIDVNVYAYPAVPTVTSPVNLCQGLTGSALTATGTNLKWYDSLTNGNLISTPTPSTSLIGTPAKSYFVTQSSNGCESQTRAQVDVNVYVVPVAPIATTPVSFVQNTTATALTATGSNILWYTAATGGTGVSVAPIPSTTTVGSPSAQYWISQTSNGCESPRFKIDVNTTGIPFIPGNIAVVEVGGSPSYSSNNAITANTTINEYNSTGTLVLARPMPTTTIGANYALTNSGSQASEGNIVLSPDHQYLCLAGYNATLGTAGATNGQTIQRVAGFVDVYGSVNTSTLIPSVLSGTGGKIMGAVCNGNDVWIGGGLGLVHTIKGATTNGNLLSTASSQVLQIVNNQLLNSDGTHVNSIGTGLPTSGTPAIVSSIPNINSQNTHGYGFIFFDMDAAVAGNDLLYIADQSNGIFKYSFDGTTWTSRGFVTTGTGGATGVTGYVNCSGGIELYFTVGQTPANKLYKFTDIAAYNANISNNGQSVPNFSAPIVTAGQYSSFRGVTTVPYVDKTIVSNENLAGSYANITINSGTVTLTGNVYLTGTLTVNSGATLVCGNYIISSAGNYRSTFTLNSGAILQIGSADGINVANVALGNIQTCIRNYSTGANYVYNGTIGQVTGNGLPKTVSSFTINNANGVSLNDSVDVIAALNLNAGKIITGNKVIGTLAAANVNGASSSSYVNGKLKRNIPSGTNLNVAYAVGDNANYLPVNAIFSSVSISGNMIVETHPGDLAHNILAASCIDSSKDLNRYWQFTPFGVATYPSSFSASVSYPANNWDNGTFGVKSIIGQNYSWTSKIWANDTLTSTTLTATFVKNLNAADTAFLQIGANACPTQANDNPCAASNSSSTQGHVANEPYGNLFGFDNGAACFSGLPDNRNSNPPLAPNLVYFNGTTAFASNNFSTWEPTPTCGVTTGAKTIWLKFKAPTINEADVEIRTDYTTTSPAGNTWILAAYRLIGGTACINPVFTRLMQNGTIPYCSSNGVLHLNGSDLVNYAGGDIYLQVMAPNGGGGTYMVSIHGIVTNPSTTSSAVTTTTIPVTYGTITCQSNNLLKYLFWRPTGTNGYNYTGVAGNAINYTIQGLASGVTYDIWSLYRDGYTGSALYEKYLQNNTETGCSGGIAPTAPVVTPQYQGHCSKALVNISLGATNPAVGHLISNFPYRLYWQKAGTTGYSVVALQAGSASTALPYVVAGLLSPYSYNFWYVAICNGGAQVRSSTTTTPTCSGAPRTGKDEAVYEVNGVYFVNQPMSEVAAYYEATHEVPMDGNEHYIDIHEVAMPNALTDMQSTTQTESETSHALTGSFNLLPNPTTDRVKVSYNLPSENLAMASIKLMDMAGRVLRELKIENPTQQGYLSFDLSELNSGIYLVNITTEGYTETKKLVVSK